MNLAALLEKQKAERAAKEAAERPKDNEHVGLTTDNAHITSDVAADGEPPKDSTLEGATGIEVDSTPAPAQPDRPAGLRFNIAGAAKPKPGSVPDSTRSDPAPEENVSGAADAVASPVPSVLGRLGAMRANTATAGGATGTQRQSPPAPVADADFSLDDLANADADSFNEQARPHVHFADEIPATAPTRELPEELTQQQRDFVQSLDGIYTVLDDTDMFAQLIRIIMIELQQNPEYIKLVQDQDVHVMIRAMRNTMGLARVKKQESKAKRSGGSAATKKKGMPAGVTEDMLNDLNSLAGIDFE